MTTRPVRSVVLLGLFLLAAAQACGADDESSPSPAAGGFAGGDASTNDSNAAGQGGGSAGSTSSGGAAGSAGGAQGGASGNAGATGTGGAAGAAAGSLFKYPHAWTKDVSGEAKSSRSDAIIAALNDLGGWGNGNNFQVDFSIAVMNADGATPRKTVNGVADYCYSPGAPDCEPVPMQMPIPVAGNAEGSADYVCDRENEDCHILVIERTERKLYELYSATQAGDSFEALGAFVWNLDKQYTESLRGDQCTSADAAGLPLTALLPTADEVASGDLGHALRFILPNARMKADVYVRPATHAGGPSSTNPDAPPYGVRFRLRSDFDESAYSQGGKVILQALKKYGMILSDGGDIALTFADDKYSTAKWASLGVEAQTFFPLAVSDFEVVDLGPEIDLTYDCVRNP